MALSRNESGAEIVSLSSLRGIAAWWVVLYHGSDMACAVLGTKAYPWLTKGYLAVDLFFVLSGFIIAKSYGGQFIQFSFQRYRTYLWLRIARVYPLHIFMLLAYLLVPAAILTFSSRGDISNRFDVGYYILSIFLMQNWGFTANLDWNVPAWSISTEWLAYILFPFLLMVANVTMKLRLLGPLILLLLMSIVAVFAEVGGLGSDISRYGAARCVLEFWAGICLFRLTPTGASSWSRASAALVFVVLSVVHVGLDVPDYLVMPAAFMCLVLALSRDDGITSGVLANPVLHWLGTVSYSTYLSHVFIREWVRFLLVREGIPASVPLATYLVLTVAVSALLYRYIELPGRRVLRNAIGSTDGTSRRRICTA